MLAGMDAVLEEHRPDWTLVYGDTNSTLAGALSAVKMGIPLAHLEAGLRSFNRRMPEEHNRVLTDHAADLCLAPTEVAMGHLADEGLAASSVLVGDVMTDVLMTVRALVADREPELPDGVDPSSPFHVATLHRAENTDDPQRLAAIVDALARVGDPVVLLAHPRLRHRAEEHGIRLDAGSVVVADPLPYPQLIRAVMDSAGVITDSGGLQKEAFLLRVPCATVRTETEWTETVDLGWNVLCSDPADAGRGRDPAAPGRHRRRAVRRRARGGAGRAGARGRPALTAQRCGMRSSTAATAWAAAADSEAFSTVHRTRCSGSGRSAPETATSIAAATASSA